MEFVDGAGNFTLHNAQYSLSSLGLSEETTDDLKLTGSPTDARHKDFVAVPPVWAPIGK